jgi:hypothetical protein
MEYNYESLNRQFNLHRAETERVISEAREALATLERNQHLLNQHQRLMMRLQEIKTRQALVVSRITELKLSLKLLKIELEALEAELKVAPEEAHLKLPPRLAQSSSHGAADGGGQFPAGFAADNGFEEHSPAYHSRQIDYPNQVGIYRQIEGEWKAERKRDLRKQLPVFQLELVELLNLKAKFEKHRGLFEAELSSIEHQLQLSGISANRG